MPSCIKIEQGEQSGVVIALIEKAGCTSIQQSIKGARINNTRAGHPRDLNQVRNQQVPLRIYLRHPIKRFISAWRYFNYSLFPEKQIPRHAPFEKFVDCVLDQLVGNVHWNPQLKMFEGCNITELYRFEDIAETWPSDIPLRHLNASHFSVRPPEVIHRLDELEEHYREDLTAWENLKST